MVRDVLSTPPTRRTPSWVSQIPGKTFHVRDFHTAASGSWSARIRQDALGISTFESLRWNARDQSAVVPVGCLLAFVGIRLMGATTVRSVIEQEHRELVATMYMEHSDELRAIFYHRCKDAELANDVTHEAFRRLLEQAADSVRKPLSWLRRVGSNLLIDRARRTASFGYVHALMDELVASSSEPAHEFGRDELLERLREALLDLRL